MTYATRNLKVENIKQTTDASAAVKDDRVMKMDEVKAATLEAVKKEALEKYKAIVDNTNN